MTQTAPLTDLRPLSEINTTPLIDVLLVLLVMLVITIPAATHSLEMPLPQPGPVIAKIERTNRIVLTANDQVLWNGTEVDLDQLSALLAAAATHPIEPELRFQPEGNASYGLSSDVLRRIKASGLRGFGFVGNEVYADFGAARRP